VVGPCILGKFVLFSFILGPGLLFGGLLYLALLNDSDVPLWVSYVWLFSSAMHKLAVAWNLILDKKGRLRTEDSNPFQ